MRASSTPVTISQTGTKKKPKIPSGVNRLAPITTVAQASGLPEHPITQRTQSNREQHGGEGRVQA